MTNGDPRKKVIADGRTYFAVKTRRQEFEELYALLNEDDRRLFLRDDIKRKNMSLAEAAKKSRVITATEYAKFQDAGYMGLYDICRNPIVNGAYTIETSKNTENGSDNGVIVAGPVLRLFRCNAGALTAAFRTYGHAAASSPSASGADVGARLDAAAPASP